MTITLEVPDETLASLLADAKLQGRSAASIAVERLAAWDEPDLLFSLDGSTAELDAIGLSLTAIEEGRMKDFDPKTLLSRFGVSNNGG